MKVCPYCQDDIDDDFELCWNCQYSFDDDMVLNECNIAMVCSSCNAEVDSHLQHCSNCRNDLKQVVEIDNPVVSKSVQQINCLRCRIPMLYNGNFQLDEGTGIGAYNVLFDFFINRESIDLYFCPKCGKVEFFLPEMPT